MASSREKVFEKLWKRLEKTNNLTWVSSGSDDAAWGPGKWGRRRGRSFGSAVGTDRWKTPLVRCSWRSGRRLVAAPRTATGTRNRRRRWRPSSRNHASGPPGSCLRRIPIYRCKNNRPLCVDTDRRDRTGSSNTGSPRCRKRSVHAFLNFQSQSTEMWVDNNET